MKTLLAILLIFSGCANANEKKVTKQMSFTHLECKQKILPLKVEYSKDQDIMTVNLKAEADINQIRVVNVRGIDGLQVTSSKSPSVSDVKRDDVVEITAEITEPQGLSYLIVDIEGKVRNQLKRQTLAIPVGESLKVKETQKSMKSENGVRKKIMKIE